MRRTDRRGARTLAASIEAAASAILQGDGRGSPADGEQIVRDQIARLHALDALGRPEIAVRGRTDWPGRRRRRSRGESAAQRATRGARARDAAGAALRARGRFAPTGIGSREPPIATAPTRRNSEIGAYRSASAGRWTIIVRCSRRRSACSVGLASAKPAWSRGSSAACSRTNTSRRWASRSTRRPCPSGPRR